MQKMSETTSELTKSSQSSPTLLNPKLSSIIAFERTCGSANSGFTLLPCIILPLHTFLGYLILSQHSLSSYATNIISFLRDSPITYRLIQIAINLVAISQLFCMLYANQKHRGKTWYSSLKRIIGVFSVMVKIQQILCGFLLYLNFIQNIPCLLMVVILTTLDSLLFTNHHTKKDQNYYTSQQQAVLLQGFILGHLVVNALIVAYADLQIFIFVNSGVDMFYFAWMVFVGYKLFFHQVTRCIHLVFSTLLVATGIHYLLLTFNNPNSLSLIELIITILATFAFLYVHSRRKRIAFQRQGQILAKESVKDHQINMFLLLEGADENKDYEAMLIGLISYHAKSGCSNDKCWSKEVTVYDPFLKHTFNSKALVRERDSALRFYLKCLYEQALSMRPSPQLLMDYCQFIISQFGDFSNHCHTLSLLSINQSLGLLDKIRLTKLKLILHQQSQAFNKIVHGGKIQLLEVMNAEETYEQILDKIEEYCQKNQEIWKLTTRNEVNISEVREKLQQVFEILPILNQKWNFISKFLTIQKQWKYSYLNYVLYIKNQKTKNKDLENQGYLTDEINEETPFIKQGRRDRILSDYSYFDKRATIIMTYMDEEQLKFSRVSKTFEDVTHYPPNDVLNCSLTMILPKKIRKSHDRMVQKWLEKGHTTDQNSYYIKNTHFINKYGKEISSLVIFKQYIDLSDPERLLKLLCLIKINMKQYEQPLLQVENESVDFLKQGSNLLEPITTTTFTLNPNHNIFLKDDNLQPVMHSPPLTVTKIIARLLLVIILISIVLIPFRGIEKIGHSLKITSMQKVLVDMYNLPIILGQKYFKTILGIGNTNQTNVEITKLTQLYKSNNNQPETIKAIFNPVLNQPKFYHPFSSHPLNQNISYSQVDLFYFIASNLVSLSSQGVNHQSKDFIQFHSYLTPSYSQMMNSTKNNLHISLQEVFVESSFHHIIYMIILSCILILAGVCISYQIFRYRTNMAKVIDIIVQFNDKEIGKSVKYWQNVQGHFRKINRNRPKKGGMELSEVLKQGSLTVQEEFQDDQIRNSANKASLNQKHKQLVTSPKDIRKTCKLVALVLILLIGMVPLAFSIRIFSLKMIKQVSAFQLAGYHTLQHFPTTSIIAYALFDKRYSQTYPLDYTFELSRFKETLSTLQLISQYKRVSTNYRNSLYMQKEDNYLFGNPCTFNPDALTKRKYSYETCVSIQNRALSNGITTYLRSVYPKIASYLQGNTNLTSQELQNLSDGLSITSMFFTDAIWTWQTEFAAKLTNGKQNNIILSVIMCLLVLLLHFIVFECILLPTLRKDYKLMKAIFTSWVPEHILTNEKIIKHQFYQSGILKAT